MTTRLAPRYSLDPAMPVLLRPDGVVQIGWDPRRAVLVAPPDGMSIGTLAGLLRSMRSVVCVADLHREATRHAPVSVDELTTLIDGLVAAGVASPMGGAPAGRAVSVRVHGRGPLSDLLVDGLRGSGVRLHRSSQLHATFRLHGTDLVVLADSLVADPRLLGDLHAARIPHLAVRVRDGTGLIGPLVIPGVTSCLTCAELHRGDHDQAWPAVAAQLRDTVGVADRPTVLATAALALGQVQTVVRAVQAGVEAPTPAAPTTLSTTLELDVGAGSIATRHWPRHPRCNC